MNRRARPRTALAGLPLALALGCHDAREGGAGGMDTPAGRQNSSAEARPSPVSQSPTNAAGGPATGPGSSGSPEVGATRETRQGSAAPAGSGLGANGPGTGAGSTGPTDATQGSTPASAPASGGTAPR